MAEKFPRTLFFGTPHFSARTLQFLLDAGVPIVGAVTRPETARSRRRKPSEVAQLATEVGLPLFAPGRSSEIVDELAALQPEVCVVVVYGELLRKSILELAPLGCVNVHPSLLPKYRGPSPVQRSLMAGDSQTGVTIMRLVREMDAGPIYSQVEVEVPPDIHLPELDDLLCDRGNELLLEVLADLKAGRAQPREQDHSQATFTSKVTVEECEIDWSRPALEIHNLVRGASGRPSSWCWVQVGGERRRLKIHRTALGGDGWTLPSGLTLVEVQLEGKRRMEGKEFLRGYSSVIL